MDRTVPSRRLLSTAVITLAVVCVLALACRGTGIATSTGHEPSTISLPVELPTPEPTNSGPGRIRASIESDCKLLDYGAEVSLSYRVNAIGANRLSRVQMTLNGAYSIDTGAISQVNYIGERRWRVAAGTRITILLMAESAGNPTTVARSLVQCPKAPEPSRV